MRTFIWGILLLNLVIIVHEFGHYSAARHYGIYASEFSVGFGKKIFSIEDRHGTKWSVRLVLLGGFCAFNESDKEQSEVRFDKLPWIKKIVILSAGPAANIVSFICALLFSLCLIGIPDVTLVVDNASELLEKNPYLYPQDEIVSIFSLPLYGTAIQFINNYSKIAYRESNSFQLTVIRNGAEETIRYPSTDNRVIADEVKNIYNHTDVCVQYSRKSFIQAVRYVIRHWYDYLISPSGFNTTYDSPLGLGGFISYILALGGSFETAYPFHSVMQVFAWATLNAGLFNILPIPPLDGGKIAGIICARITGYRLTEKFRTLIACFFISQILLIELFFSVIDVIGLPAVRYLSVIFTGAGILEIVIFFGLFRYWRSE